MILDLDYRSECTPKQLFGCFFIPNLEYSFFAVQIRRADNLRFLPVFVEFGFLSASKFEIGLILEILVNFVKNTIDNA